MKRYVIIGDGVAGVAAARAIRERDPAGTVTIFSDEDSPFYSRPLIVDVMTGMRREEEIILLSVAGHRLEGFDLRLGATVEAIDGRDPAVVIDGERFPCDRLLIATGARAKLPFPAVEGVFPLRNLADARAISVHLPRVRRAIVYGGGPIGMKAAHALLAKGIPVAVVVTSDRILSRVLDERAAGIVEEAFLRRGAVFHFEREIVDTVINGGLCAVVTDRGEEIPSSPRGSAPVVPRREMPASMSMPALW